MATASDDRHGQRMVTPQCSQSLSERRRVLREGCVGLKDRFDDRGNDGDRDGVTVGGPSASELGCDASAQASLSVSAGSSHPAGNPISSA